jgi:hypothetical protein
MVDIHSLRYTATEELARVGLDDDKIMAITHVGRKICGWIKTASEQLSKLFLSLLCGLCHDPKRRAVL